LLRRVFDLTSWMLVRKATHGWSHELSTDGSCKKQKARRYWRISGRSRYVNWYWPVKSHSETQNEL
ncbi:MAG: hypothetical protein ACM3MG_01385, partial [Bacillota bacterium]